MAGSPKDTEKKLRLILNGWKTLAPEKSFGGMTYAEFETAVQPSFDTRQRIINLEEQMTEAITERENADEVSARKAQQVVNGVRADSTEGPDSALYESFGYTPDRARASGMTRKGKKKPME